MRIAGVHHASALEKNLSVGSEVVVRADLDLAGLEPNEVLVEIYHGLVDPNGEFLNGAKTRMTVASRDPTGKLQQYVGTIPFEQSGLYGYSVRVMPRHPDLAEPRSMGLVHWA